MAEFEREFTTETTGKKVMRWSVRILPYVLVFAVALYYKEIWRWMTSIGGKKGNDPAAMCPNCMSAANGSPSLAVRPCVNCGNNVALVPHEVAMKLYQQKGGGGGAIPSAAQQPVRHQHGPYKVKRVGIDDKPEPPHEEDAHVQESTAVRIPQRPVSHTPAKIPTDGLEFDDLAQIERDEQNGMQSSFLG